MGIIANSKPIELGMYFAFGKDRRPGVQSLTTYDAILNGERTATTRFPQWYRSNPSTYEKLKSLEPGNQVIFYDKQNLRHPDIRKVLVEVQPTKLGEMQAQKGLTSGGSYILTPDDLKDPRYAERWSRLEGWTPQAGINFFDKYGPGLQFQYLPIREL